MFHGFLLCFTWNIIQLFRLLCSAFSWVFSSSRRPFMSFKCCLNSYSSIILTPIKTSYLCMFHVEHQVFSIGSMPCASMYSIKNSCAPTKYRLAGTLNFAAIPCISSSASSGKQTFLRTGTGYLCVNHWLVCSTVSNGFSVLGVCLTTLSLRRVRRVLSVDFVIFHFLVVTCGCMYV